jgi:hypothetical protein
MIGEADLPCAIPATRHTYVVEYEGDFPHAALPCPYLDPGHSDDCGLVSWWSCGVFELIHALENSMVIIVFLHCTFQP